MSAVDHCEFCPQPRLASARWLGIAIAAAGLIALAFIVWRVTASSRLAVLALVGGLIGLTLERSSFGFAGGFRRLLQERDASHLKAQIIMFGLMSAAAIPLVAGGEAFGLKLVGVVTPVGVAFALGALMFGIGMQLGGGCASGTLFGLGGGDLRLVLTLAGLIGGSTLGASHMGYWWTLPKLEAVTLWQSFSLPVALLAQAAILGAVWLAISLFARKTGAASPRPSRWTLLQGAVLLAALNLAVLLLSGQPWGEAPAFALWGSKLAAAAGIDVFWWDYWSRPGFDRQIEASIFTDSVSIITIGIVLGALGSALQAGTFRFHFTGGLPAAASALIGGTLMGYGARLTNGCNIGAYFSAVGTGALSGWVWLAFALVGSYVALKLMPLAGLGRATSNT